MKSYHVLTVFFFLFLFISAVSAHDDNLANSTFCGCGDDILTEPAESLNETHCQSNSSDEISQLRIETNDLVKYFRNDSQFDFKVVDNDNNPKSGENVIFNVKGINYTCVSDDNGTGSLPINLNPGKYVITTFFKDKSLKNTVVVLSRISAKDVSSTYSKQTKFTLTLLDRQGNLMPGQQVEFKVHGVVYKSYADSNGVATLNLNLAAGTYTITYSVDGISGKNTYRVKNYYKLTTYKWGYGADVTKNKKIKSSIPNSDLVKKVVKAAKSGIPLIKFQGGSGKIVFITAGVHGNELPSQVAAMQLIKYLETHPIKGTVYIMPFMNPKATSKNVRNYGVNLNSHANKKGTLSYKTVNLIVKFKCNAYGDFHCTKPGGKPGKDVAMGSYLPTSKSATLAKYISKNSKVKYLIYKKAGVEYPGALEDTVNLKRIPAVTCEVISPHGKMASGKVSKSLSMMKSLLKFNSMF